jgi:hypothetical protein
MARLLKDKLQKLPTAQKPVHGVEVEKFPQAKETIDVRVQDQTMLICFLDIRGIMHTQRDHC